MKKPRFSIVIPTLNEERFLPGLLESLIQQTEKRFEVIVVDGNSRDKTQSVALSFQKKLKLQVIVDRKRGVSRQRNLGVKHSIAEWVVFIDADSVLLPQFLERIDAYIRFKNAQFFTTWLKADSDKTEDVILGLLLNIGIEASIIIDRPWAPGPLTIIRRDVFDRVGGYDEKASYGEDHDLAIDVMNTGVQFTVFREMLYIYSLRRFRKEGVLTVTLRNLASAFQVLVTGRGPKRIKGYKGGGEIFSSDTKPKAGKTYRIKKKIYAFLEELVSL